jgi:hypothetical protein
MWDDEGFRNREEGGGGLLQSSEIQRKTMWDDAELRSRDEDGCGMMQSLERDRKADVGCCRVQKEREEGVCG